MGAYITDTSTADILFQLNNRFAPGPALDEMVVIQKEFGFFSEKYTLKQAFRALHIVPDELYRTTVLVHVPGSIEELRLGPRWRERP